MSGDIKQRDTRIVYEMMRLEYIMPVTFDDGMLSCNGSLQNDNGKIMSLETGATPMPK